MGPAHIDRLLTALRDDWHVGVEVEPVRTSLRETFLQPTVVQGRLVKQSGGHGQYAVCRLEIEPLERGAGIEFAEKVVGGAVPRQFIPSVEKGVRAQLQKGVLAGYPMVDVRITLVDGKAHSVDSSDMAFQTAAATGLREAANESTVGLLEPIDALDITVAEDSVGSVLADLRGRRGQVHGTETADQPGSSSSMPRSRRRALPVPDRPALGVARDGQLHPPVCPLRLHADRAGPRDDLGLIPALSRSGRGPVVPGRAHGRRPRTRPPSASRAQPKRSGVSVCRVSSG